MLWNFVFKERRLKKKVMAYFIFNFEWVYERNFPNFSSMVGEEEIGRGVSVQGEPRGRRAGGEKAPQE